MVIDEYGELMKEKEKLYALLAEAKKKGIPLSHDRAIIKQSEKIDALICELQKEKHKPSKSLAAFWFHE